MAAPILYAEHFSRATQLAKMGLRVDGTPFSLSRYPFLIDLVDRRAPFKTILKGSQIGFTTICVLDALMSAKEEDLRGILYLFPTDNDVFDFSKARFAPMASQPPFSKLVSNTDSAGLKIINGVPIYFRAAGAIGTSTKATLSKLKSVAVDRLYFDERDEMQDSRVENARHRLDGSMCPEEVQLSTPTIPGYGVDAEYKLSSMGAWHWLCSRCNGWTCLEMGWPDCIADPAGEDPYYLCSKCRERLERTEGDWVHAHPDRVKDHLGFSVSQLCSPTKTPGQILQAHDTAIQKGRLGPFYNHTLARPFAEIEDQLTPERIADCLTEIPRSRGAEGPTCMGVDPGVRKHHYWIKQRVTDTDTQTLTFGAADSFEELAELARKFHVQTGVMDQGAEKHAVRSFVDAHHGWWGCQYNEGRKAGYDWDHTKRVVHVNRTQALDASHAKIIEKREQLPAPDERYHDLLVPQLCNMARVEQCDQITGDKKYRWVVLGVKNDHLKHAHAYATIAEQMTGLAKSVTRARRKALPSRHGPRSFMAS